MDSIEDLRLQTSQRIKVLEALDYVLELEGGSVRQVRKVLGGLKQGLDEDIQGIVVLPLGYDNKTSFCNLYNVYSMPKSE